MSEENESTLSKVIKWLLKMIWKLILIVVWGFCRLAEVLIGQIATLIKSFIS